VQVHHGFDVKDVRLHTVNYSIRKTVKVEFASVALEDAPALRLGLDTAQGALKFIKKVMAQAGSCFSYQTAAASNSCSASGWLATCIQLGSNVPHGLRHRAAWYPALLDLAGAAFNNFAPLRFRVHVHNVVETGNELTGQECPILKRQRQHFGDFFSGNAHIKVTYGNAGLNSTP